MVNFCINRPGPKETEIKQDLEELQLKHYLQRITVDKRSHFMPNYDLCHIHLGKVAVQGEQHSLNQLFSKVYGLAYLISFNKSHI